jgi:hypothetical protein
MRLDFAEQTSAESVQRHKIKFFKESMTRSEMKVVCFNSENRNMLALNSVDFQLRDKYSTKLVCNTTS